MLMNVWKPIALCSVAGLVASVWIQTASAGGDCANQPHMKSALEHLRGAKAELAQAEQNKGGWREKAAAGVETALRETNTGCADAK
jgi:hypothetical protein